MTRLETKDAALLTEVTVTVARTHNLGNYNSVRVEASARVSRNEDDDTSESLRERALEEVRVLLNAARREHTPRQREE